MASERSKRRDLLALSFITKSISKKLLIKLLNKAQKITVPLVSKACYGPESVSPNGRDSYHIGHV